MVNKDTLCGILEFDTPSRRKGIIIDEEKKLIDIWTIINNISDKKGGDLIKKYNDDALFIESYNAYFITNYFLNFKECVPIINRLYLNTYSVDEIIHYRYLYNSIPRNFNRRVHWKLYEQDKVNYTRLQKKINILMRYLDVSKRVAMYYLDLYSDERLLTMENEMEQSIGGVERV